MRLLGLLQHQPRSEMAPINEFGFACPFLGTPLHAITAGGSTSSTTSFFHHGTWRTRHAEARRSRAEFSAFPVQGALQQDEDCQVEARRQASLRHPHAKSPPRVVSPVLPHGEEERKKTMWSLGGKFCLQVVYSIERYRRRKKKHIFPGMALFHKRSGLRERHRKIILTLGSTEHDGAVEGRC